MMASTWLIKLILSHLITDFILQPRSWVDERNARHFASAKLYLHGLVTALLAWVMTGWQYWDIALVIGATHILIDGWKSFRKQTATYFLVDQLLHLLVILGCWTFTFRQWSALQPAWQQLNAQPYTWKIITAFVFLTLPAGILIGQFTQQWRDQIADAASLANAGKWIGIIERIIILALVLKGQYAAIGLLVAAKGIIRFNEKDRPEIKTEYLVIGTLMSIGIAIITGLLVR
ncbi:DUF3307 domain-containing protein [Chitinophaga japonensis]|uniref:Uncharacterized protein DUF3307 n=1 Tax=Chitinophaga japonensis TaxID=104662 RepID=A0A562SSJ1_CHIJA|nr:DUF3307 domain-containing protein [Chitinophaga japonensis]TWI84227.1 uncharacterized protein DUF3307 [Chitinophaga japonensis]